MKRIHLTNLVYKSLLVVLICSTLYFLVSGDVGITKYYAMKNEVVVQERELRSLKRRVNKLELTLADWNANNFYLEKMAREELCMGYPGEIIYRW